ncbi:S-layer homology domain-containing protein [Dysosmobacter sp. Phy]
MAQNKETVVQVGAGSGGNGGIVFNGKSGTVYGDVTLEDDLEIASDETLTIPDDSSLNSNGKLTNNGKIIVDNGGKLEGTINGSQPPKITTERLNDGTVNTKYNQTLVASGDATITWSSSDLPNWLTLNSDGTISGTPTAAGASTFTVTATNASGSDSKEFTLTISEPAPIYTISADVDPVGAGTVSGGGKYTAGTSVTLTATNNPGYRFVGWVESGTTVSTNPNYTFVANSNRSLTTQFDRISSGGGDSDPTYSITLPSRVTGGELKLSRRYAEKGETVTLTAIPDEGYELDTLTVTDSKGKEIDLTHKGGNEYTFKMPAGRVEIEVSFREIAVELPFTDVPEGVWYEDAAAYVYEHGLMAGISATTFAPDATTSRSMIATILWRMAGSPVVNYAMDYTDVAQGQWYSEAIRWASSEGIVGGYGNGLFGTNDPITREQFAAMLYRFAQEQGYDVSIGENTNILSYTDVADLSEYAISAMQWAVGAGIINGTGDGSTLTPQGQATRAQAAVMLMRFCEEYVTW